MAELGRRGRRVGLRLKNLMVYTKGSLTKSITVQICNNHPLKSAHFVVPVQFRVGPRMGKGKHTFPIHQFYIPIFFKNILKQEYFTLYNF